MEKVAEVTHDTQTAAPSAEAAEDKAANQVQEQESTELQKVQETAQGQEDDVMADESEDMGQFEELFEQSLRSFQEGEIINGTVVSVDHDYVMVDIGYKSEGLIPTREFLDAEGNVTVQPGDTVEVLLERWNPEDGTLRVSHAKAVRRKVWDKVIEAFEAKEPIEVTVLSKVKGGLTVLIGEGAGGIKAFLPYSQVDVKPHPNLDKMIGQKFKCSILDYNRKRQNVVVSRRELLEKELAEKKKETLATLEEGQVREGVVKNITEYGAFVDLGGIDGLLHVTDISWGRVEHPSKVLKVGDKIKVKVLSFDPEKEKVALGIKQLTEDPWLKVAEKYPEGSKVKGKVVNLTEYGAFVELEEGVEGLIHVSEMSWTKRIRHPKQILEVGDEVEAVVLKVDPEARRISLGLKQVQPNPWDVVKERYPEGTVIEGTVKNITDFGLFIGIEDGIDGLVHVSDLSWSKRIKHPSELYQKGDKIQAVVLNIDKEKERFSLGVKQLQPDPWESAPERFPVGSKVTGKITNVTDFGIFVELEEGIEGLIHVSEIAPGRPKSPVGKYEVGSEITAKVINVSPQDRRIGLSIKKMMEDEERSFYSEYSSSKAAPTTLGLLLQEELVKDKSGSGDKS